MPIKACNNFVFIIRDETESETKGLIIPDQGKIKPHKGEIFSVGSVVKDIHIKNGKGKKAIFPSGAGFETEFEGTTYLVIEAERIFAVA